MSTIRVLFAGLATAGLIAACEPARDPSEDSALGEGEGEGDEGEGESEKPKPGEPDAPEE